MGGEIFLPPELWSAYQSNSRSRNVEQDVNGHDGSGLSQRQVEVLNLVSEGYSNREAAAMLGVSENTVKTHMKRIFRQLNVNTRAACVRRAQSLGLIS